MDEQSFQVYLSSTQADRLGANNSDATFRLPMIEIPSGCHIWLSVQSAVIPVSFYNINSTNNALTYSFTSDNIPHSIVLINGNYSALTLTTLLNQELNVLGFTVSYNRTTNKLSFSHSVYNFSFSNSSTCFSLLGLSSISQTSVNRVLTSDFVVNVAPIRAFQIAIPHINTGNISKTKTQCQNILCQIPITLQSNGIVTYLNTTNISSNLYVNYLHELQIQILDQNSVLVDLNGVEWSVVIQFDIIKYIL